MKLIIVIECEKAMKNIQRFIFYYLSIVVVITLEQEDKEQSAFVTVLSFYLTNLYPKLSNFSGGRDS